MKSEDVFARAFPVPENKKDGSPEERGVSKLGYYSAAAMQGLLSMPGNSQCTPKTIAKMAVDHAFALLEELEARSSQMQSAEIYREALAEKDEEEKSGAV